MGDAQALSGSYQTGVKLAVLTLPAATEMDLAVTPPDSMSISLAPQILNHSIAPVEIAAVDTLPRNARRAAQAVGAHHHD